MKWTIINNKEWNNLEKVFPWVATMKDVPQDVIHHAEGNVAIHTHMVLEQLIAQPDYKLLSEQDQEIVWAAALLHDVEKRSTTVHETNGRITSRGHAKKGEFTARQILFSDVSTPFHIRETIAALVRCHGLPLWIMEKKDPVKSLLETSLRVDMQLLCLLAKADALGRICHDQNDLLYRIELFQAFCMEQECWHSPRTFATNLARFTYFNKLDSSPDYNPFDNTRSEVILMSGLPGMGKDRYIQLKYPTLPVVSLDEIRRKHRLKPDDASATGWAVQEAKEQAKSYLRKGEPFIWNATNITRQMRAQWIDLFVSYKARVKIVYVEVPYKDWLKQNREREYPVPGLVLQRLLQKLEVPQLQEANEVIYEIL